MEQKKFSRSKIGPVGQKVLLLLMAGVALGLSGRPDKYFRVIRSARKEWKKINRINNRSLHQTIKNLYRSKLIEWRENKDGTLTITLSENGKKKAFRYNFTEMEIKKPLRWDKVWRMVIFDIPEKFKRGRDALSAKLKELGFYSMQKSVFIHPYDCKNEVDFIVENFNLRPYVRFLIVKETDIDLHLKTKFGLK